MAIRREAHGLVVEAGPIDIASARVLTFHRSASGAPVVAVMTWEGEAEGLPRLVAALGPHHPVHAVTPPVGEEPQDFPRDVDAWPDHIDGALAAAGVAVGRHWVGWSFGGVAAARAAQRRWEAAPLGERPHVILLDSRTPTTMDKAAPTRSAPHRALRSFVTLLDLPAEDRRHYVAGGVERIRERRRRRAKRSQDTYMTPLRKAIFVAWWKYEAAPIDVEGTLLWCDSSVRDVGDRFLGWGDQWQGPFHARRIGTDHFKVFEPPVVTEAAAAIAQILREG